MLGQGAGLDLHELEAGPIGQIDHAVGAQHHRLAGASAHGADDPCAHTHRQSCSVQQLLVVALAAEVVEVLMRQAKVRQVTLAKSSAITGVPNQGQLADTPVVL